MATSTNYLWSEPDNTSLVKDGAQAIRTLGNAIDTSLWNSGYGQAGKNKIINGNLDWWQRGTSFAAVATATYTADRWQTQLAGTSISTTVSRETTVPNAQSLYSIKVLQSSGSATSVTAYLLRQPIEIGQVENLAGATITLSFYYRSNKTGSHSYRLLGDNATGSADSGGTFTVNVANTWEKKTLTTAVPLGSVTAWTGAQTAAGLYLDLGFRTSQGGFTSVALNDYFQVAQVQIEYGSTATPFQTASGGSIQGELAMCQRYYQRYTISVAYFAIQGITANSTTVCRIPVKLPSMRIAPTILDQSGLQVQRQLTDVQYSSGTWTIPTSTTDICILDYTHGSAVFTAGETLMWRTGASGGYFGFSAEL